MKNRVKFKFGFRELSSQVLIISRGWKTQSLSRTYIFQSHHIFAVTPSGYAHFHLTHHFLGIPMLAWHQLVILIKIAPQPLTIWPTSLPGLLEIRKKNWTPNQ